MSPLRHYLNVTAKEARSRSIVRVKRAVELMASLKNISYTIKHPRRLRQCNALQHIATHCNALQRTATHCNALQRTATHCNALQCTAMHCNALQTHCNTQIKASHPSSPPCRVAKEAHHPAVISNFTNSSKYHELHH